MTLRLGALNFLILFIILLLAFKNYEAWTLSAEVIPGKETAKKPGAKIENPPVLGSQKEPASIQSYISIAEKNIFSPERKDFPIQPSPEAKKPIARPQIVLYGVTIAGDYEVASIVNPGRTLHKGERETLTVKAGERIGEYKLAKILPDRIMMEGTEDSFEVLLYDPKTPKKRIEAKTEVKPPAVTSAQPVSAPTSPPAAEVPKPPAARVSAEKPREPVQRQITPPPPSTRPPRPSFPQIDLRRGRRTLYPPAGTSTQTDQQN